MAILCEQAGTDVEEGKVFMLLKRLVGLRPRTPNQKKYLRAIR